MRKSSRLFSALALFALLFVTVMAGPRFVDAKNGFSLAIPDGWKAQTPTSEDEVANWVRADEEAEISVLVSGVGPGTLQDLVAAFKEDVEPNQILNDTPIDLGGREAHRIVIEFEVDGTSMVSVNTMMVAHQNMYAALVVVAADEYRKNVGSFHAIGDSFLLEEGD
jgi:PsbP